MGKTKAAEKAILIDFPKRGETVRCGEYAIRISSRIPGFVEVSIDDGEWTPCREALGFWWYDWSGVAAGHHKILARLVDGAGTAFKTPALQFEAVP